MPTLSIQDKRALIIFDDLKERGMNYKETSEKIGAYWTAVSSVKKGERSFTVEQLIKLCKLSGVSMDWICGLSKEKYRITKPITISQKQY